MLNAISDRLGRALLLEGGLGLWALGFGVGLVGGYAVIGLRAAIDAISYLGFGVPERLMSAAASELSVGRVWIVPIVGGVAVGTLTYMCRKRGWLSRGRAEGVAEVIEARAIHRGQIKAAPALASAVISAISVGSGGSAGREGPAVHLGGAIAAAMGRPFGLSASDGRTLLACGAAAAVSASFNAPIAGVLFALEIVLGHYALSVFGPVTLASVTAAVIARIHLGNFPAFSVPEHSLGSVAELPAALMLGALAGLVAILFMRSVRSFNRTARWIAAELKVAPEMLAPIGGVVIGAAGALAPELLGVGYEAIDAAVAATYAIPTLLGLLAFKIVLTAVTLGCRFGGGVFAPALYLGAMLGGAFGLALAGVAPFETAGAGFYAMVGMGAVSGAVLGAPISTTLIVFELTGEYQMTIALLVAVSVARWLTQAGFDHRSYFHAQLADRGYDLSEGPQGVILQTLRVRDLMTAMPEGDEPLPEDAPRTTAAATLETALAQMSELSEDGLPVVESAENPRIIGYLSHRRALAAYNKALLDAYIEEHR
ncbi:MAG: chloride channel protein [Pseudomonadota bacterium]